MENKRISKKHSVLFWLLAIAGSLLVYNSDHLKQQVVGYQSETRDLHYRAAPDTASNVSSEEHVRPIPVAGLDINTDEQASATLPELIYDSSEHFADIDSTNLDGLLERIGDSRVVLLGEATHGTREFYEMRARITRELIENKGFNIIAVEADWPDASSIDHFVRSLGRKPMFKNRAFAGFPSWMWANQTVLSFTHWLKDYNRRFDSAEDAVGFYGLDLYNLFGSIEVVLDYLQVVDPRAAEAAHWRYGCLLPWISDPSLYSRTSHPGRQRRCEYQVHAVLRALLKNREYYSALDKERYFSAEQNARLVTSGERYFGTMFRDNTDSWNQRDLNMFKTLQAVLRHRGATSKAVVWAHNSHVGDTRATEFSAHGEFNLGQLVREAFGDEAFLVGFGTDQGTVAAASEWGGPMKVMQLPPAHKDSYEHQFHEVKADNFLLPLRHPAHEEMRTELLTERLQRAIGTAYDPEDELKKHYFQVSLPRQFDEYIWFDETHAVEPLAEKH